MEQNSLPYNLQKPFLDFINKRVNASSFFNWLYESDSLEKLIGNNYLELIGLNENSESIRQEVQQLISFSLDYAEYERQELILLLNKLLTVEDFFPKVLGIFYELYIPEIQNELDEIESSIYSLAYEIGVFYDKDWVNKTEKERINIVAPFSEQIKRKVNKLSEKLRLENPLKGNIARQGNFPRVTTID